jgi:hypothetical protein
MKTWLRGHQRGTRRVGLVASSGGRRLKAVGYDVQVDLPVEDWFLNPANDVRSSFYLESPATEFGIQGLELDWVGLSWEQDLVPSPNGWIYRAFRGTEWQSIRDSVRQRYILNKYRVLLTRAREGMIIWVPQGDHDDRTRPPERYDAIADYLERCGIPRLDR